VAPSVARSPYIWHFVSLDDDPSRKLGTSLHIPHLVRFGNPFASSLHLQKRFPTVYVTIGSKFIHRKLQKNPFNDYPIKYAFVL